MAIQNLILNVSWWQSECFVLEESSALSRTEWRAGVAFHFDRQLDRAVICSACAGTTVRSVGLRSSFKTFFRDLDSWALILALGSVHCGFLSDRAKIFPQANAANKSSKQWKQTVLKATGWCWAI